MSSYKAYIALNCSRTYVCSGYTRRDEIKLVGNVMSCYLLSQVEAKSTSSWHQNWLMLEWTIAAYRAFFPVLPMCHCVLKNVLLKHILDWPLFKLSTCSVVPALHLFFVLYLALVFGFSDFMLQCNAFCNLSWLFPLLPLLFFLLFFLILSPSLLSFAVIFLSVFFCISSPLF